MPQGGHTLLSPPSGISAWRPRNARLPTGHTGVTTRGPRFTQRSIMQTRRPRRGRADQHAHASACVMSASARIPGRAVSQRRYDISVESRKRAAVRAHQRTKCSILTAEPASSSFCLWRSRAFATRATFCQRSGRSSLRGRVSVRRRNEPLPRVPGTRTVALAMSGLASSSSNSVAADQSTAR